jgi:Zn-dependent protease
VLFGQSLTVTLFLVPAVLYAIVFHEVAHGLVARSLGDPTAERAGRLTLNPLPHIDWIGALALLLVHFGWAKPVPVDPRYFKRPYRDSVLVALAGPGANAALAIALGLVYIPLSSTPWGASSPLVQDTIGGGMVVSVALGLFNLVPIPPLDGSRLLFGLTGGRFPVLFFWLERLGFILLIGLLLVFGNALYPVIVWAVDGLLAVLGVILHPVGY